MQTSKLQQENTALKARMAELESGNRSLAREAYSWRSRYEQLAQHSGLPSSQQHLQPPQQPQQQQPQPQQGAYVTPGPDRRVSIVSIESLHDPLGCTSSTIGLELANPNCLAIVSGR